MSSELFRALDFAQLGAVACFCSLGAATLTELLFPAYDSRRNTVWQGIEGILGMVFHYLVGIELFTLLCPLRYIAYPATVFAVFSPVMLPNTLAKMNNAMGGLAGLVRPVTTWTPPSPVGPPRPAPGTRKWEDALKRVKDGAARAILDLNTRMDQAVAEEVAAQVDALELQMRAELGTLYADYMASRDAKVKQVHDELQSRWAMALASLRQGVTQARVNAKKKLDDANSALDCVGAGMRKATNAGYRADGVAPFCVACPPGYSWQQKTGADGEQFQLATVRGDLVCKPVPVVPSDPDPNSPATWENTTHSLKYHTYAYTDDPHACAKTMAGLKADRIGGFFDEQCGTQLGPIHTVNPETGDEEAVITGCSDPNVVRGVPWYGPLDKYPEEPACYTCTPPVPGQTNFVIDTGSGEPRACGSLEPL